MGTMHGEYKVPDGKLVVPDGTTIPVAPAVKTQ